MQKTISLLTLFLCFSLCGQAQFTRYIIKFKDKGSNPFSLSDPSQYLSQRALDRRARYHISIDSTDLPVTPRYIDSVRLAGNVTILNISKWFNQVAIQTSDAVALNKINSFPFVESTTPLAARNTGASPVDKKLDLSSNFQSSISCSFFTHYPSACIDNNGNVSFPINYDKQANFDLPDLLKLDYSSNEASSSQTQQTNNSTQTRNAYLSPVNKKMSLSPRITNYAWLNPVNENGKLYFPISYEKQAGFDLENKLNLDYSAKETNTSQTQQTNNTTQTTAGYYNYGQSDAQVKIHNGDFLHNHGFRGEGMQMAILDAGFFHYLTLPTFDSVRNNNQVLGTWDFVANEASVNEDFYHGMQCFSTIAANMPGSFVGTAPKTSFYLFRTEDVASEYPIEEQNWAAGIEKADSLGVDISSTSLGYSQFDNAMFNHTYADMDGNTTISAKAADMAAKKGILVVSAAGNEGNNGWHFLITPSDADSSLCVGAVDVNGNVAGFSSYGPSSDGQIKPSVAAVGANAVVANPSTGQPSFNSGTSFACPNMAGITTCLWQAFPEVNNMEIITTLEASATRSINPDDRSGYGIPDAKKAFVILQKKTYTKQETITACSMNITFSVKTDNSMVIDVERKGPGEPDFTTLPGSLVTTQGYGLHPFSFTDQLDNLSLGAYQYRLRMTIGTDTTFYLDELTADHAAICTPVTENSIKIGPNPFSDYFNIIIGRVADSKIEVVIRNAVGQKVYLNNFQQQPGLHTWSIPMNNLSKGVYFVTVYANGKKEITKKIIKQ